ncbi:MAG: hypothetical protein ACJAZT_001839 [Gammaproteobacteria bacterium]|jgi:hypothetical protein
MPLSKSIARDLAHTRVVTCHGYKREDGLWDIEGRIVDTKPYRFVNKDRGGWIEADEALHDISIRITIDIEMTVTDAEAVIDSSPYTYCKCVVAMAKNLIGLKIVPGWTLKSKAAMGKNRGCTHLTELLGPVATTAIQTISSEMMKRSVQVAAKPIESASLFLNSCHSLAADSPVVKENWPNQYQGKN